MKERNAEGADEHWRESAPNLYMFHCHILEHEDHGMMGQFVVVEDLSVEPELQTEALDKNVGHSHPDNQ